MKRSLLAALVALAVGMPLIGLAGMDEGQRQVIWRAHEAKRKQGAFEAEQQRQMQAHARLMSDARAQLGADRPPDGLSVQQLREWLGQHLRRMDDAMSQLVDPYGGVAPGPGK